MEVKNKVSIESSSCSSSSNEIDAWDDRLLLDEYNLSIERLEKFLNIEPKPDKVLSEGSVESNKNDTLQDKWKKDDFCRAKFSKDNRYYEAILLEKSSEHNSCLVKYIGYNNLEVRPYSELKPSKGDKARHRQEKDANVLKNEPNSSFLKDKTNKSFFVPPPPAFLSGHKETQEDSALSSMLMSWYMCGYHTGYYDAIKKLELANNK